MSPRYRCRWTLRSFLKDGGRTESRTRTESEEEIRGTETQEEGWGSGDPGVGDVLHTHLLPRKGGESLTCSGLPSYEQPTPRPHLTPDGPRFSIERITEEEGGGWRAEPWWFTGSRLPGSPTVTPLYPEITLRNRVYLGSWQTTDEDCLS